MNQLKKIFVNNDSSLVTVSAGNPISDPQAKWEYGTSEDLINQKFAVKDAEIDEKIEEQDELISGYDQRINLLQNVIVELDDKVYDPSTYSGLGRKLLKKKTSGVNTLYQEDINIPNTIYVIQYDFVLGEDIEVPANCVLQFEGGHIDCGNFSFSGDILNSWLDVSNFTTTIDITKAINVVWSLTSSAFVPKGIWTISDDITVNGKILFGFDRMRSEIRLNGHSIICKGWYSKVRDLNLCNTGGTETYAIVIKQARFLTLENLHIHGLYSYNPTNNKGSGILLKNDPITQSGEISTVMALSRFSNIYIHDVQIGIKIDATTNMTTPDGGFDYVTSCHFENITVDVFYDSGIIFWGSRIYENSFDNITIRDNCDTSVDRKGLEFYGACNNRIRNLKTWADAKGGSHNFYAIFVHPTGDRRNHIDGEIEGLIGGNGAWTNTFNSYEYNMFITHVDSVTRNSSYAGIICNYNMGLIDKNITNIFNFNNIALKSDIRTNNATTSIDNNHRSYIVSFTNTSSNGYIEIPFYNISLGYIRIFYRIRTEGMTGGAALKLRIIKNGSTVVYNSIQNYLSQSSVYYSSDIANYDIRIAAEISGTGNIDKMIIDNLWILTYPDENTANLPDFVYAGNYSLLNSVQIKDLLPVQTQ